MGDTKKYILNDIEIFPFAGEFDFGNDNTIEKRNLTLRCLATDISNSIYGPNTDIAKKAYEEIYRNLYMYSEKDPKRRYGLIPQIKRTLGVDLRAFIDVGSNGQKIDTLKLIKLLYKFIKLEPKSRVIPLLETPSLDNIQSDYFECPYYTEIQEIKRTIDYLNTERKGEDFQEPYPLGDEEFAVNEVVFRNRVLYSLFEGDTDVIEKLNSKMNQIKNGEAEDCRFTFNEALQEINGLDVLQVFSFALDRYYLKCLNKTYLNNLEDLMRIFDSTDYFTDNDELYMRFMEQEGMLVPEEASVSDIVDDLLKDKNVLMLITGNSGNLSDDDKRIISHVQRDAKYVLRNYITLNREERYDSDLNILENTKKKSMWIAVLQMLYICRKENLSYTSDSMGDKVQERSLKEVFAKWNPEENRKLQKELSATKLYHRKKSGVIIDIDIDDKDDRSHYTENEKNNRLRNKGKEYLFGKMFPQLIYARNILSKKEFDIYIQFLKNYHEIQDKLCENILFNEFAENCNRFFDWVQKNISADICYEIALDDIEEVESEDKSKEENAAEELYAYFRRDFLEDEKDTYDAIEKKAPEFADEIREWAEEKFIAEDIDNIYQGIKTLLPFKCKNEFQVLQNLVLNDDSNIVYNMLLERCKGYQHEAFYFLRNIFDRIEAEKYNILKKLLKQKKFITYSEIKSALEERDKDYTKLKAIFPKIKPSECEILVNYISHSNKFEFCILNKLIHRE